MTLLACLLPTYFPLFFQFTYLSYSIYPIIIHLWAPTVAVLFLLLECGMAHWQHPRLRSQNGFKAIFLAVDLFTGYIQLYPLKDRSTQSLIEAVDRTIIGPHSVPKFLRSDNESGFDPTPKPRIETTGCTCLLLVILKPFPLASWTTSLLQNQECLFAENFVIKNYIYIFLLFCFSFFGQVREGGKMSQTYITEYCPVILNCVSQ